MAEYPKVRMSGKLPIVMTDEVASPPVPIRAGMGALPSSTFSRGERAGRRLIEFFTANIRNRNTRLAYARAVKQFFDWTEAQNLRLDDIERVSERPTSSSSRPADRRARVTRYHEALRP
jgi:hypothetical protein